MDLDTDTRDVAAVTAEIERLYQSMFPHGDGQFVARAIGWTQVCFAGQYPGFQAIDARYHDFEHTLQGTLCQSRLLFGRHAAGALPPITQPWFELGLLAILLHDTGYLKEITDTVGTGAKFTFVHVERSKAFARHLLAARGYSDQQITSVQRMIQCTGVKVPLKALAFSSDEERLLGYTLGTADLLGQMAAPDYVAKLPILYDEFAESARYEGLDASSSLPFSSSLDLLRKTDAFWQHFVLPKINHDFGGVYRFLNHPYPDGPNPYLDRIQANLKELRRRCPK
jgi:hypothetical protein